jgi:hypothetical protein
MAANIAIGFLNLRPYLEEYLELKDLGKRWIRRIKELAEAEKPKDGDVG